jgi:hypothetical protein
MNTGKVHLIFAKAVFWGFTAILSIPLGLMLAGQRDFSPEIENRRPHPLPALKWGQMHDFPRAFEAFFSDSFGLRSRMIAVNSTVRSRILGGTIAPNVLIGREGWLFYKGEHFLGIPQCNLQIFYGTYPLDSEFLEKAKNVQLRLKDYFGKRGIQYALVLVPSKISIYPEFMKGGGTCPEQSAIDVVSRSLCASGDLNVINLRPDLLKMKETAQIYHKTDTHWNDMGILLGCQKIAEGLGLENSTRDAWTSLVREPKTYTGDLSKMLGGGAENAEENIISVHLSDPKAQRVTSGNILEKLSQSIWLKDAVYYAYENPKAPPRRLLCFGDSFFLGSSSTFHLLFAEAFSFSAFLWSDHLAAEYVEAVQPDIVIWEVSERRLKILAEPLDPSLLLAPLESP